MKLCETPARTHYPFDYDPYTSLSNSLERRSIQAQKRQLPPPGHCKRIRNEVFQCFHHDRKCSVRPNRCTRNQQRCECDHNPYRNQSGPRLPGINPPLGRCKKTRPDPMLGSQFGCFNAQKLCAFGRASSCRYTGDICDCEIDNYARLQDR